MYWAIALKSSGFFDLWFEMVWYVTVLYLGLQRLLIISKPKMKSMICGRSIALLF